MRAVCEKPGRGCSTAATPMANTRSHADRYRQPAVRSPAFPGSLTTAGAAAAAAPPPRRARDAGPRAVRRPTRNAVRRGLAQAMARHRCRPALSANPAAAPEPAQRVYEGWPWSMGTSGRRKHHFVCPPTPASWRRAKGAAKKRRVILRVRRLRPGPAPAATAGRCRSRRLRPPASPARRSPPRAWPAPRAPAPHTRAATRRHAR